MQNQKVVLKVKNSIYTIENRKLTSDGSDWRQDERVFQGYSFRKGLDIENCGADEVVFALKILKLDYELLEGKIIEEYPRIENFDPNNKY